MDVGSFATGLLTGLREGVEAALIVSLRPVRLPAGAAGRRPGTSSAA